MGFLKAHQAVIMNVKSVILNASEGSYTVTVSRSFPGVQDDISDLPVTVTGKSLLLKPLAISNLKDDGFIGIKLRSLE